MEVLSLQLDQIITGQAPIKIETGAVQSYRRKIARGANVELPLVVHRDAYEQAMQGERTWVDEAFLARLRFLYASGAEFFLLDGNHRLVEQALRQIRMRVGLLNEDSYLERLNRKPGRGRRDGFNREGGRGRNLSLEMKRMDGWLKSDFAAVITLQEQMDRLVGEEWSNGVPRHETPPRWFDGSYLEIQGVTIDEVQARVREHKLISTVLGSYPRDFRGLVWGHKVTDRVALAGLVKGYEGVLERAEIGDLSEGFLKGVILNSDDVGEVYDAIISAHKGNMMEIIDDKEVVLVAVSKNGFCLEYASDRLKADRDVVVAAIENEGDAFEYAAVEFRGEKELLFKAMQTCSEGIAFHVASRELRSDREVIDFSLPVNPIIVQTVVWGAFPMEEQVEILVSAFESAYAENDAWRKITCGNVYEEAPKDVLRILQSRGLCREAVNEGILGHRESIARNKEVS